MISKLTLVFALLFTKAFTEETNQNEFQFIPVSTTQRPTDSIVAIIFEKQLEFCSKLDNNIHRTSTLESQMLLIQKTLDKTWNISEKCCHKVDDDRNISNNITQLRAEFNQKILEFEKKLSQMQNMLEEEHKLNENLTKELSIEKQKLIALEKTLEVKPKYQNLPKDCLEVMESGNRSSGIYLIQPRFDPFLALCDMTTKDGGWTVFQKRFDGSQNFDLNWKDYKNGFGNLTREFWLGLDYLHRLTVIGDSELLVKLVDKNNKEAFAHYHQFSIGNENEKFSLKVLTGYNGDAGDSLDYHRDKAFCTKDHDKQCYDCATTYEGGWWFGNCLYSNLNGKYLNGTISGTRATGINWYSFSTDDYSLLEAKMMVRRRKFRDD